MPKARRNGEASIRDAFGNKHCPACDLWLPVEMFTACGAGGAGDGLYVFCRPCKNSKELERKHGLTSQQVLDRVARQGGCASCGKQEPGGKGWVIDHDHDHCTPPKSCEKCHRGILCTNCNIILGHAHDDRAALEAVINYLKEWGK